MNQKKCVIEMCQNKVVAKNFCNMHYKRFTKYGDAYFTKHKDYCTLENCNNKHYGNGFCIKHNERFIKYNDPLFINRREPKCGSLQERFNKSYDINDITGCWEWNASVGKDGYAKLEFNDINGKRKLKKAHRLSYELYKGEIPEKMCVCHTCDNKICVNPDHLWIGTHTDNMKDCSNKNRHPIAIKGIRPLPLQGFIYENSPNAKLKNDDVILIKLRLNNKEKLKDIAKDFNVSFQTISDIKRDRRWKGIELHHKISQPNKEQKGV